MDERAERIERRIEPFVMAAALLVVPAIVLDEAHVDGTWQTVAEVLNWVSWSVFALEAVVMLSVVRDRGRWLREHPLEVAIVLLTLPFVTALASLRLLRLLALLRLVRVGQLSKRLFSMSGLRYAALLAVLTAFVGGSAFAALEDGEGTWNGVYWAITTMTTVGYGDPAPTTTGAKIVAVAVMLVGIGFVAVLTGAIAQRFLTPEREHESAELDRIEASEKTILAELRVLRERIDRLDPG